MRFAISFGSALTLLLSTQVGTAQVTVQQPVIDRFSVATTVSVPDRGRAFLGGVNSAGESRSNFGPLRSGSNTGQFRSASSASVSVFIHDFEEMDRQLLGQAGRGAISTGPTIDGYRDLLARSQRRGSSLAADHGFNGTRLADGPVPKAILTNENPTTREEAPSLPADQGERSFRLAEQAERRGALAVARLHYQMAARHGHGEAEERLASLKATAAVLPDRTAGSKAVPHDGRN